MKFKIPDKNIIFYVNPLLKESLEGGNLNNLYKNALNASY